MSKIKNLSNAKRVLLSVPGGGNIVVAVSREAEVTTADGTLTVVKGGAAFTLHYGERVSETASAIIADYCKRQGMEAPAILSFPRPSSESSKGDASPTGWEPSKDDDGTLRGPAFRLEYEAVGCRVKAESPVQKVLDGGEELVIFSSFAVSDQRLGSWGKVKGSPLLSALNESAEEKAATDRKHLLTTLAERREAMVKDCARMIKRDSSLTIEDLSGVYPADVIAEAMGPQEEPAQQATG